MADLAATDVAYTEQVGSAKASPADPRRSAIFTLVFGDGALTYPAGGVPLTKAKLGCPTNIDELQIMDAGTSGFNIKFDSANGKIRLFNPVGAHTHDITVIGGLTSSEALFLDASQKFGKNAATNRTIVGATSATTGGVAPNAAAVGSELGNVAFAAVTIKVKVVGF